MPVPANFKEFISPIHDVLHLNEKGLTKEALLLEVFEEMKLSANDLLQPSSFPHMSQARRLAEEAFECLCRADYVEKLKSSTVESWVLWKLTERGRKERPPLEKPQDASGLLKVMRRHHSQIERTARAGQGGSAPAARKEVAELQRHLEAACNVVLHGPPGTGKTFHALQLINHYCVQEASAGRVDSGRFQLARMLEKTKSKTVRELLSDHGADVDQAPIIWEIVQAHPGLSYEDFVRGLHAEPVKDGTGVHFVPRDGIIVQLARIAQARAKTGRPVVLIIDELNRCNVSAVFGELILILEKAKRGYERGVDPDVFGADLGTAGVTVRLQYSGDPNEGSSHGLMLPPNLWVIGTMNTADRSIALVDYAIRRRFRFVDVQPNESVLGTHYEDPHAARKATALMRAVNQRITNSDLKAGHSYFMVDTSDHHRIQTGDLREQWATRFADKVFAEVLPLLFEYAAEGRISASGELFELYSGSKGLDLRARYSPSELEEMRQGLVDWLQSDETDSSEDG